MRVNREKSKISRPDQCHLLGFGFRYKKGGCIPRVSERPKEQLKEKIRAITKRNRGVSIQQVLEELNMVTRGWINYFRIAGCKTFLARLDGWIRIRLRTYIWKQWQFIRTRIKKLKQFDIPEWVALTVAKTRKGAVRIASTTLSTIMTSEYLTLSKILCKWKQDSVVSLFLYLDSVFKHKHKLIHNQAPV